MKPEERASQTVTFRLTRGERALLENVAIKENKSLTDTVRDLILKRALELGVDETKAPRQRVRPGRPKTSTFGVRNESAVIAGVNSSLHGDMSSVGSKAEQPTAPSDSRGTVADLVSRFRDHFADRAEGTRKELQETIGFLFGGPNGQPLLPADMLIKEIESDFLKNLRKRIKEAEMRFSKKNLHLTYLRMLLNFASKQGDLELGIGAGSELEAFTAKELADAWPGQR